MTQSSDGTLYGTTDGSGGANGYGTVFKITTRGRLTTLHSFDKSDGWYSVSAPIQASDGNFYGVMEVGGTGNAGTIYEITAAGKFSTLYEFCGVTCTGEEPTGLRQATNGELIGTTVGGAAGSEGMVYSYSLGLETLIETAAKPGARVIILGNNLTGSTSVIFNGTPAPSPSNPIPISRQSSPQEQPPAQSKSPAHWNAQQQSGLSGSVSMDDETRPFRSKPQAESVSAIAMSRQQPNDLRVVRFVSLATNK